MSKFFNKSLLILSIFFANSVIKADLIGTSARVTGGLITACATYDIGASAYNLYKSFNFNLDNELIKTAADPKLQPMNAMLYLLGDRAITVLKVKNAFIMAIALTIAYGGIKLYQWGNRRNQADDQRNQDQ